MVLRAGEAVLRAQAQHAHEAQGLVQPQRLDGRAQPRRRREVHHLAAACGTARQDTSLLLGLQCTLHASDKTQNPRFYSPESGELHLQDAMPPMRGSSAAGSGRGMSTKSRSPSSAPGGRCSGCTSSAVRDRYSFSVKSRKEESTAMGTSCGRSWRPLRVTAAGKHKVHLCVRASSAGSVHDFVQELGPEKPMQR